METEIGRPGLSSYVLHDCPHCRLIDFVATFSMLLDIPAIFNALNHNYTEIDFTGVSALARGTLNTPANKIRQITSVCRILRLMRLVYLYNRYELHKQVTSGHDCQLVIMRVASTSFWLEC